MIQVNNGYILTPGPTQTTTFSDNASAQSHPVIAPKLLPNGKTITTTGFQINNDIFGDGAIIIDALHISWHSAPRYYHYADAIVKFKLYFAFEDDAYWRFYKQYSYDNGETWSTPYEYASEIRNIDREPNLLKSRILPGSVSPYNSCLFYNGTWYIVCPLFYITVCHEHSSDSAGLNLWTDDSYGDDWCAILEQEPLPHSDYIHTITASTLLNT